MKGKIGRRALVSIVTLIYLILFSSSIIANEYAQNSIVPDMAIRKAIIYAVMAFGYTWAFIFFLTIHRLVFAIFLPIIFGLSAIASYFIRDFKIQINDHIIPVVFETNLSEASGFMNITLVSWVFLVMALSILLVAVVFLLEKKDKKDAQLLLIAGAFVFSSLLLDGGISSQYLPYNYLKATGKYFYDKESGTQVNDISKPPAEISGNKNLIVVFVIGESARAENFHINGYERQTTPLLEKQKNLISFTNTTSCAAMTRDSVPCMVTRATSNTLELSAKETSFIGVFKKLGFKTAWIDVQGATSSVFDSPIVQHASEADKLISMNNDTILSVIKDENSLPYLKDIIKNNNGSLLVVIHSFGNHWPFDERYGEQFRKWKPVCGKTTPLLGQIDLQSDMAECDHEALVNEYDNAILYTDWFLNEVIDQIKDRNSFLVYSSDHGESLGEDGVFLHGNIGRKEQRHVPMFMWFSEGFADKNPDKVLNLAKKKGGKLSHDNIFHSILGCSGVKSEVIDKKLNLCE